MICLDDLMGHLIKKNALVIIGIVMLWVGGNSFKPIWKEDFIEEKE